MTELKPILTKVSQEEYDAIMAEADVALEQGDSDEYNRILRALPLSPFLADDLKRSIGIQGMIEERINLSRAVEAYGEEWLRS
ncbi:MAG: hypothetical protein LBV21_01830 [Candidatus Adiutrix sp.]|jgi:hypothetical protein|nr:hypothetical protein [Candidatus Adiutrix sp.]